LLKFRDVWGWKDEDDVVVVTWCSFSDETLSLLLSLSMNIEYGIATRISSSLSWLCPKLQHWKRHHSKAEDIFLSSS
jgi:hypothetical protein